MVTSTKEPTDDIIEVGIALILVYPYWLSKKFLKKRILLKFIINEIEINNI